VNKNSISLFNSKLLLLKILISIKANLYTIN